ALDSRLESALHKEDKTDREVALALLEKEVLEKLAGTQSAEKVAQAFQYLVKAQVRRDILEKYRRPDGRGPKDIRPISCEVSLLPRTHGSGLFTRGQTQVLSIATLGAISERQKLDTLGLEEFKRFLHHYNMPPFSNGEVRRLGSPGRREVGHGALAERALLPVIPPEEEFPYTIRLVSEVLSSNGSTSMASVCGSTLSLMDAGVPIKAPVGGVAMGLVKDADKHAILTDIAGMEDALGDMDFKVAGTAEGVTALQMDIKIKGISPELMAEALAQAKEARLFILAKMKEAIAAPRPQLSPYAPRMTRIHIKPDKIGALIGPGGKNIRSIIEQTKCTIDVEDDGSVVIGSTSEENSQRAISMVEALTREAEVGAIYTGKVTRITDFGAFVEIIPGKDGLVRVDELSDQRVDRVEDVVKIGDEITVMVIEIDRMGRINLSRRAVLEGAARPVAPREREGFRPGGPPPRRGPFPPSRRDSGPDRRGGAAGFRGGTSAPRGPGGFRPGPHRGPSEPGQRP
ncbi:MAG: polyribonucleotide nucleotidyltransferase, partial [Chloroflexi bacterium]|nr:polyribonucleotide nucleotidyltransferase [Chloroflexota bacterium]